MMMSAPVVLVAGVELAGAALGCLECQACRACLALATPTACGLA